MSTHVRTQLRQALQVALTGLPTTLDRVSINRSSPVPASRTPCLLVTTPSEEVEQMGMGVAYVMRNITVQVDAVASGDGIDDQLDQMAAEVEQAIFTVKEGFSAIKGDPLYQGMQLERDDSTSPPLGYLRMTYQISLITAATDPKTPL